VGIDNGNTGVALEQIVVVREHIEEPAALAVLLVPAALAADNSVLDTAVELACNADILGIVGLVEEGLEELACNADILDIAEPGDTDDIQEE